MNKVKVDHKFPRLHSAKCEDVEITKEYKSGATFQGLIENYKKVGRGVFTWPNGDRYEGQFADNVRHGKGKQTWADGSEFEGDFVQDMRHGQGNHCWQNGEKYKGAFFRDRRHGRGEYTWPDNTCYRGSFYKEKKEGYASLTFADGREFQGLYKNDEREGPGVMTYPGGAKDVGFWHREQMVRICTEIPNAFTMKNHPEFDYDPEQNTVYIEPELIQNRTDVINNIINPPEDFRYTPDSQIHTETESIFSDTLDTRSQAADVQCFDEAFFAELQQPKSETATKKKKKNKEKIKAWNKTPSCIAMQKHVLKHKNGENLVNFSVSDICQGKRGNMGPKGPLETASEELILASSEGDVDKVWKLLHSGEVSPDVTDFSGFTSLIGAAINWHQDIIHCLLDNGADVNKLNNEGISALAACHIFFYPFDCFRYNIAEKYLERPPDFVQEEGYDVNEAVKSILAKAPKKRTTTTADRKQKLSSSKRIQQLRKEYSQVSIAHPDDQPSDDENDILMDENKNELLEPEFNRKIGTLNIRRSKKPSREFFDSGESDADSGQFDLDDDTRLSEFESNASVHNMDIEVTDHLIERCATHLSVNEMVVGKSRTSSQNEVGTARRLAVEKSQHVLMQTTIKLLLHRGADPNASRVPMPVLFFAIKAGDVDAVKLLLLKGANTKATLSKEKGSLHPLHIAVALPGEEGVHITEQLLDSLGDPDVRAAEDDSFLDRQLEEEWSKDVIDETSKQLLGGRTPLQIACARDDNYENACRVVHLLLDHHANPNLLCNGFSPLALAIASGNDLAVDELLAYGADASLKLTHGVGSALCVASSTEHEHRRDPQKRLDLIDKLVNAEADILAPIPIGPKRITGTAVDYAYYMFNLDRRIAHMPYHALTHAERETYNARRSLLAHIGSILRNKAVEKERFRMEEEELEGRRSHSPSPSFVYTGSGAKVPSAGPRRRIRSGHVSFQEAQGADLADARKPLFKYCYECGRSVGVRLSACTRCKEVYYCSKACKLKAWNARHKEECIRIPGQSRSPSPKGRIDSPTPATDPDRGKGNTLKSLAGNMQTNRIKLPQISIKTKKSTKSGMKYRAKVGRKYGSQISKLRDPMKGGRGSETLDSRLAHLLVPKAGYSISADEIDTATMDNYSFV